jgi:hypothetical protein
LAIVDPSEERIRELSQALLCAEDEADARTKGDELRAAIRVHLKRVHDQLKAIAASSRFQT